MSSALEAVPQELALLVALALKKGIDVRLWLNPDVNKETVPEDDFLSKFTGLCMVVGMQESPAVKEQLDRAISKSSTDGLVKLFSGGLKDPNGENLINVTEMIALCNQKAAILFPENEDIRVDDIKGSISNPDTAADLGLQAGGAGGDRLEALRNNKAGNRYEVTGVETSVSGSLSFNRESGDESGFRPSNFIDDDYIDFATREQRRRDQLLDQTTATSTSSFTLHQPQQQQQQQVDSETEDFVGSHSSRIYGNRAGEIVDREEVQENDAEVQEQEVDEEKEEEDDGEQEDPDEDYEQKLMRKFTAYEEKEVDDSRRKQIKEKRDRIEAAKQDALDRVRRKEAAEAAKKSRDSVEIEETSVNRLMYALMHSNKQKKREIQLQLANLENEENAVNGNGVRRSGSSSNLRSKSADGRISRTGSSALASTSFSSAGDLLQNRPLSVLAASLPQGAQTTLLDVQIQEIQHDVEDLVRKIVKQTDLYHIVQVHLGFVEQYIMNPFRGQIVSSKPRPFLSLKDLQTAFTNARLRLNEIQLLALLKLVKRFAEQQLIKEDKLVKMRSAAEALDALDAATNTDTDYTAGSGSERKPPSYRPTAHEQLLTRKLGQSTNSASRAQAMQEPPLPQVVVSTGHRVNAEWFRRYLVHLRLFKKEDSPTGPWQFRKTNVLKLPVDVSTDILASHPELASAVLGHDITDPPGPQLAGNIDPVTWTDWLGRKIVDERLSRPKDFQLALLGRKYHLSKEEMNNLLEKHVIVPDDVMAAEIDYRVRCWMEDTHGRRDFSHCLNVELNKWETLRKKDSEKPRRVSAEERQQARERIVQKMIKIKTEELRAAERQSASITRDLFWKYDRECRDRNYNEEDKPYPYHVQVLALSMGKSLPPLAEGDKKTRSWIKWLEGYRESSEQNLIKFRQDQKDRKRMCASLNTRRKSVAAFSEVANELQAAAKSMPTFHKVELQKSLVALRKAAMDFGIKKLEIAEATQKMSKREHKEAVEFALGSRGALISKEEFDRLVKPAAAAPAANGPAGSPNGATAVLKYDELFQMKEEEAAKRVVELQEKKQVAKEEEFKKWREQKDVKKAEELLKKAEEEATKKSEEEKKKKKAEKAYKKWLRLRSKEKYTSKIGEKGGKRPLPTATKVAHKSPWNKDVDLKAYYAELEKVY